MSRLLDRVDGTKPGRLLLRAGGVPVTDLLGRLEAGEAPVTTLSGLGLAPADLVAAVAADALGMDDADEALPLVQARAARPGLDQALDEQALEPLLPRSSRAARLVLVAGLLQVLDFWDASHEAAQAAGDLDEGSTSAYWHGIAHRREPDAGNATYWFRRVGRHSVFGQLWTAAQPLLEAGGARAHSGRLGQGRAWDPFAMIELCTTARGGTAAEALARRLQRLEMLLLLEATAEAAGAVA